LGKTVGQLSQETLAQQFRASPYYLALQFHIGRTITTMSRNDNTDDDVRRKRKKRKKRKKDFISTSWKIKYDFNPSEITQHFWRL